MTGKRKGQPMQDYDGHWEDDRRHQRVHDAVYGDESAQRELLLLDGDAQIQLAADLQQEAIRAGRGDLPRPEVYEWQGRTVLTRTGERLQLDYYDIVERLAMLQRLLGEISPAIDRGMSTIQRVLDDDAPEQLSDELRTKCDGALERRHHHEAQTRLKWWRSKNLPEDLGFTFGQQGLSGIIAAGWPEIEGLTYDSFDLPIEEDLMRFHMAAAAYEMKWQVLAEALAYSDHPSELAPEKMLEYRTYRVIDLLTIMGKSEGEGVLRRLENSSTYRDLMSHITAPFAYSN